MDYQAPSGAPGANDDYVGKTSSTQGSKVPPRAVMNPQRELVNLEKAAGLIPSHGDITQIVQSVARGGIYLGNLAGTVNAKTGVVGVTLPGLLVGMGFRAVATAANTGAVTINLGGFTIAPGVLQLLARSGTTLQANDILPNVPFDFVFDGAAFRMASTVPSEFTLGGGSASSPTDAGMMQMFAKGVLPSGWLKANGALVSRTTYANLFAAIGTTFGAGDGSTTFAVPEVRGEFLRCLDDGRGVDAARALGSFQNHMYQQHFHPTHNGAQWLLTVYAGAVPANVLFGPGGTYAADDMIANGAGNSGYETRPRNVAFLAAIRY